MNQDELWKTKLLAYLWNPPYYALAAGNEVENWRQQIIDKLKPDDGTIKKVEKANGIAISGQIPSFATKINVDFVKSPVFKHPLSGQELKLSNVKESNFDSASRIARDVTDKLLNKWDQPQSQFLGLWRILEEEIIAADQGSTGLRFDWQNLPANSTCPSFSIWDNQSIVSAIASALPEPALLLFTIASTQPFIATARRTQDFWLGSFIISYLVWQGIKLIGDEYGPDCFIYPSVKGQPLADLWLRNEKKISRGSQLDSNRKSISSFPNSFTAIVPRAQGIEIAKRAVDKMNQAWKEIASSVKERVETACQAAKIEPSLSQDKQWNQIWQRQIEHFLDYLGVFYVICPWDWLPKTTDDTSKIDAVVKDYKALFNTKVDEGFENWQKLYSYSKGNKLDSNLSVAYPLLSTLTARVLSARKNLRDFRQTEEPGDKCTLCGVREALHPNFGGGGYRQLREFWDRLGNTSVGRGPDKIKLKGRLRRGERLCATCLTKRLAVEAYFEDEEKLGLDHHLFPSTSSMATASFKYDVIQQLGSDITVQNYARAMQNLLRKKEIFYPAAVVPKMTGWIEGGDVETFLRLDGDWLYEESFNPDSIELEQKVAVTKAELSEPASALTLLIKKANDKKIKPPSRYYAIVYLDGDNMGKWVSGTSAPELETIFHHAALSDSNVAKALQRLAEVRRPLGVSVHQALTTAQGNFALEIAPRIVEQECCGRLIYAGGDDLLSFVPVRDVVDMLRKLRWLFSGDTIPAGTVEGLGNGFAQVDNKDVYMLMGNKATCSAGAVIVHHSYPLSQALQEGWKVLKTKAKKEPDKDAFAFTLMKRGGAPVEISAKWRYGNADVLSIVKHIVELIQTNVLSSRLAYDMQLEADALSFLGDIEGQQREFQRLLDRHLLKERKHLTTTQLQHVDELTSLFVEVRDWFLRQAKKEWQPQQTWVQLTNLLLLARFLSEEV